MYKNATGSNDGDSAYLYISKVPHGIYVTPDAGWTYNSALDRYESEVGAFKTTVTNLDLFVIAKKGTIQVSSSGTGQGANISSVGNLVDQNDKTSLAKIRIKAVADYSAGPIPPAASNATGDTFASVMVFSSAEC